MVSNTIGDDFSGHSATSCACCFDGCATASNGQTADDDVFGYFCSSGNPNSEHCASSQACCYFALGTT